MPQVFIISIIFYIVLIFFFKYFIVFDYAYHISIANMMRERMKNKNDHIPLVIVSREMLKKKKFNKHAKSGLFLMSHMKI